MMWAVSFEELKENLDEKLEYAKNFLKGNEGLVMKFGEQTLVVMTIDRYIENESKKL